MFLKRVKIKNFRSLVDVDVELGRYSAMVGLNDAGKSNLLRALNLFFNGQTDLEQPLDFERDFSQQAKIIGKKARQIQIELILSPPQNYSDRGEIVWRKAYRADNIGFFSEELYRQNGQPFSKGSRVEYWARHIVFEYVPAIRGKSFFDTLKRRLYNTLAATVAPKLTAASDSFLSNLREEVKGIESESLRLLQLRTEFSLPSDLGDLFEVLEFDSDDGHASTSLHYRGDGIQGRHIPLILKFLADQRKVNSAKGKPPSETIWGFEEPENNLELVKQVEAANEFLEYSASIQVIVSTHSPAFYANAKKSGDILVVSRVDGRTVIADSLSSNHVDLHIGLMPFVEPYLEKAIADRQALLDQIEELNDSALARGRQVLYVEGGSDKVILEAALSVLRDGGPSGFDVVAKEGLGGGVNWAVGCSVARAAMPDISHKTAVLFDKDGAGQEGKTKLKRHLAAIEKDGAVRCFMIGTRDGEDHVRKLRRADIKLALAIEELCEPDCWIYASNKGWIEPRGPELLRDNASLVSLDKSFCEVLDARLGDCPERTMVEYKVMGEKKGSFASYAASTITASGNVPRTMEVLLMDIRKYFGEI